VLDNILTLFLINDEVYGDAYSIEHEIHHNSSAGYHMSTQWSKNESNKTC